MGLDKGFWDEMDGYWDEDEMGKEADKPNTFELLPIGDYDAKVVKWKFFDSENKGTPGLNMEFYVITEKFESRRIWHTFWLTRKNMPYVARDIRTLTDVRIQKPSDLKEIDFLNTTARLKCKHEEYEGKKSLRVSGFLPATVNASATTSQDEPF